MLLRRGIARHPPLNGDPLRSTMCCVFFGFLLRGHPCVLVMNHLPPVMHDGCGA